MQRQKSILSFFRKPTASSGGGDAAPPALEVRGIDTPPEKLPRPPLFSSSSLASAGTGCRAPLAFSSVMHKFTRNPKQSDPLNCNGPGGRGVDRDDSEDGVQEIVEKHETYSCVRSRATHASRLGNCSTGVEPKVLDSDLDDQDKLRPETPLMRPLVPGLKRIKENCQDVSINHGVLLAESNKRMKLLRGTGQVDVGRKDPDESFKAGSSKFEWLNPSSIRDANRRRPDDPLYDRRTLYIPPDALAKMSATQRQYWDVKRQYMDVVLFFKVGKFYELYELDAEIGQKELDWKMTHSGVGKCRQVGISESGIDDAVKKLMARGYKVGRMEQIESSDQAKSRGATSVIQRKLIHVSTPSTTADSSMRPEAVYLLALNEEKWRLENGSTMYGFAFVDVAALKFWVGSFSDDASHSSLGALLVQVSPKEIVYEIGGLSRETLKAIQKFCSAGSTLQLTSVPSMDFLDGSKVRDFVECKGYFKESSNFWSSAVICQDNPDLSICALGGMISYLSHLKLDDVLCNGDLLPYQVYTSCLKLNGQTLVNLEIFNNNIDGGSSGTLYKHLDHCTTSAGKRLLRRWICHPLINIEDINDRLNVVEGLVKNPGIHSVVSEYLHKLPDLERLLGRIKSFVGASATYLLPSIGVKVLKQQVKSFGSLVKGLRVGLDLLNIILKDDHGFIPFSRVMNLPVLTELDEVLSQFEVAMREDFPNYQDHDVQESDAEVLSQLVEHFVKVTGWSQVIQALSCLDVLNSFGMVATLSEGSMSRPVLLPADSCSADSSQERRGIVLKIKGLWHPYAVPNMGGTLVPNDIHLAENSTGSHMRTLLVTGPNMGGKSTLLRATCLATIFAQLGCFVPCDSCILSPADVIFTRLGATDRIMSGESTFFVECAETASILQNATQDSLVLLDELGRGTSTFDGYAIAYAVFRHLVEKVHCRLLFATHYHPLTKEFASHPNVSLQHMACAFKPTTPSFVDGEKELVFLYRLTPGACPGSYGLQVALMAGIPSQVVEIASQASQRMKTLLGNNFKLCEGRSMFSTLHEESLKTLLAISNMDCDGMDEDSFDTLICLWHELKSMYRQRKPF